MNIVLAIMQLASIIMIIIYEYKRKYLSVFMWATLLLMFGIPHFLSVITNNLQYSDEVMIYASLFVIIFNMVYFFSQLLICRLRIPKIRLSMVPKKKEMNLQQHNMNFYLVNSRLKNYLLYILIICLLILFYYTRKYFGSIFNASWGKFFVLNSELGGRNLLRYTQFFYFASAGIILVFKENREKFLYIVSLLCILLYTLLTGNRVTILPLLVAMILPIIETNKNRISLKNIFLLSVLGILSLYSIYLLRLLRVYGGFYNLLSRLEFSDMNQLVLDMILNGDGELSLRNAFYYFIEHNNSFPNFNKGHTYLRLLFIALPTSMSFGLKPPDFAISMGSAWINNMQNINFSMHPTLYGDIFANFWWFGVAWGIFWALFNFGVNRVTYSNCIIYRKVMSVNVGVMFIIIGRGSVYNGVYTAFISAIFLIALSILTRISLRKK